MFKQLLTFVIWAVAICHVVPAGAQLTVQGRRNRSLHLLSAPTNQLQQIDFESIGNWTGEGNNRAALVIQFGDPREDGARVYGYRWDGEANGADMMRAVVASDPRLYALMEWTNSVNATGWVLCGLGYDLDNDRDQYLENSKTGEVALGEYGLFTKSEAYDYDDWAALDSDDIWRSGWYTNGYWSYYVSDNSDSQLEYSQKGLTARTLTDGCVDAWVFASFDPDDNLEWGNPVYAGPSEKIGFDSGGITYDYVFKRLNTVRVIPGSYSGEIVLNGEIEHDGSGFTVTEIGTAAFAGSEISAVTVPSTVSLIRDRAFKDCEALASVRCMATTPPVLGKDVFDEATLASAKLDVPAESAELYAMTEGWRDFADNIAVNPPVKGDIFEYDGLWYKVKTISGTTGTLTVIPWKNNRLNNAKNYVGELTAASGFKFKGVTFTTDEISSEAFCYASALTRLDLSAVVGGNYTFASGYREGQTFKDCKALEEIILPSTTYWIYPKMFQNLTSLKRLKLPDGLYRIYGYAFDGCGSLEELVIPEGCHNYDGGYHFRNCTSLKRVQFGTATCTSIQYNDFEGCTSLEEVVLPSKMSSFGAEAFKGCVNLVRLKFSDQSWNASHPALLPESVTYLSNNAFNGCVKLPLEVGPAMKFFYEGALRDTRSLVSVEFSESNKSIESNVFAGSALKQLVIGPSVETLGENVILGSECSEVYLCQDTPKLAPSFAISDTEKAVVYVLKGTLDAFKADERYNGYDLREISPAVSATFGEESAVVPKESFIREKGYALVSADVSVTAEEQPGLPALFVKYNNASALSDGVLLLYYRRQGDTPWLVADGVYADGKVTKGLDDLEFSTTYEYYWGLEGAAAPEQPKTFTTADITEPAKYKVFVYNGLAYQVQTLRDDDAGTGNTVYVTVYPGSSNTDSEIGKRNTAMYQGKVEIPAAVPFRGVDYQVTGINNKAFYNASKLTGIVIPEGVTHIYPEAFRSCYALTTASLPSTLVSIGKYAFYCLYLSNVTIPEALEYLGDYAFYSSDIKEAVMPNLTYFGEHAFDGCSSLEKAVIGDAVTYIKAYAFNKCSKLKEVKLPSGLKETGMYAFAYCSELKHIDLPDGVEELTHYTFYKTPLDYLILPASVTTLGNPLGGADTPAPTFAYYLKGTTGPSIASGTFTAKTGWSSTYGPVYVPHGCLDAYKEADADWSDKNYDGKIFEATPEELRHNTSDSFDNNDLIVTSRHNLVFDETFPEEYAEAMAEHYTSGATLTFCYRTVEKEINALADETWTEIPVENHDFNENVTITLPDVDRSKGIDYYWRIDHPATQHSLSTEVQSLSMTSGVDNVADDSTDTIVTVNADGSVSLPEGAVMYNLAGSIVSASHPAPGYYIVRIADRSLKIRVK